METYFQGFHEDDQFSTNSLLSNVDEVMKDQLGMLESIKTEENVLWEEDLTQNHLIVGKEDLQQVMSDWQQHIGLLQSTITEDLGLGLDLNLDMLNNYSHPDLFEEKESPILSKALKYPLQKNIVHIQSVPKSLATDVQKELLFDNLNTNEQFENQKICGLIKTEPNQIRKVTLVNGEKEILGKNIIGLHCLNKIKENPDENCQVTSTVINGKRYKIIIKPKSLKVKKMSEEKIRKTLIKKLLQRNLVTKMEPKEDEIISEMRNGNYDVPLVSSDLLPTWDFANLDSDWIPQVDNDTNNLTAEPEVESVQKIAPIRIKIPKLKKHKKKKSVVKSDEEVDVETVNDKVVEGNSLGNLLKNFEQEVAKLQKDEDNSLHEDVEVKPSVSTENIKKILPKEMIERIEALKRKKDRRIPLIQAIPSKKVGKSCTRMQDAVATMNRNKLLKIVSGGDTVQLDHDYCSSFPKIKTSSKGSEQSIYLKMNLAEKNPKKDSGMESGDVSDASEGPNTSDSLHNAQPLRQINDKILEERRKNGDHAGITKAAIAFFRASNAATKNGNVNNSDSVKTKTVANGNKVLTNEVTKSICNSDNSNLVPSDIHVTKEDVEARSEIPKNEIENTAKEPQPQTQNERPKKKLKLEEYLNRRNIKDKLCNSNTKIDVNNKQEDKNEPGESEKACAREKSKEKEMLNENTQEKFFESKERTVESSSKKEYKEKKYKKNRNRKSSSVSSSERDRKSRRRRSRSGSGSYWRSSSNSSSNRRRDDRGSKRCRRSESRERRRRGFWSRSLSRSSSRESSSSSDNFGGKRYRNNSTRYRRRSRSRSVSRGRSRSRNRGYSKQRRSGNYHYYYNRSLNKGWLKSPYVHSMREKQRQIEERRVIYVGRIEEGMTNAKLRERFSVFGPIIDISLHFREYGDNYGFVTYAFKADAYDAVEHGNDDPSLPHYDLCFGGRRGFCKEKYADLDGMPTSYSGFKDAPIIRGSQDSFDLLLKEAQATLKNRKNNSKATQ